MPNLEIRPVEKTTGAGQMTARPVVPDQIDIVAHLSAFRPTVDKVYVSTWSCNCAPLSSNATVSPESIWEFWGFPTREMVYTTVVLVQVVTFESRAVTRTCHTLGVSSFPTSGYVIEVHKLFP